MSKPPFLYGSQYYRAPTPEPACWADDLAHMSRLGMNCVKFWAQWRWSHRDDGSFYWDDLDQLMDLAHANGLDVHLNLIADVAPDWLYERHPDAKPVMADGRVVEPYEVAHRQLGGHPGPCYRNPGALADRQAFIRAAIEHFAHHPALGWYDVWNEPELCFPSRNPDLRTLTCYCAVCRRDFPQWLERKYGTLEQLNAVWGRCYSKWSRVEAPRSGECIQDMIDWRHFQIDTMTEEARWRMAAAKELAPNKRRYLHVISTTPESWTHTAAATDNFALAELHDEVFAASSGARASQMRQALSAGQGRTFYNTESHINFGMTNMHPRIINDSMVRGHFLPQIGVGMQGFMLWQFRAERLGFEAPAWGMVRTDGSPRPATAAITDFFATLKPHISTLQSCRPLPAEIGLWESSANEIFHFCLHKKLEPLVTATRQWHDLLHNGSWQYTCVNDRMLAQQKLGALKVLIMPCPYYLTADQARGLDAWVRAGGVLLTEAHLGGYDGTEGRHSRRVPGFGLDATWDLTEIESTSAYHLRLTTAESEMVNATPDVQKALLESGVGGRFFPMTLNDGSVDGLVALGCDRVAVLAGSGLQPLATIPGLGCVAGSKKIGRGTVIYVGTALGEASTRDPAGARWFLAQATAIAQIIPNGQPEGTPDCVRLDTLTDNHGTYVTVLANRTCEAQRVTITMPGAARGLFRGTHISAGRQIIELQPEEHELFVSHP